MAWTEWVSALALILMAICAILQLLVSIYSPGPPLPPPSPSPADAEVEELHREMDALKQKQTSMEQQMERLVKALQQPLLRGPL